MKNIFSTKTTAAASDTTAASSDIQLTNGAVRAVIDAVLPCVDNCRFPVKCVAGERVTVRPHCFTDGHDALRVQLCCRAHDQAEFREVPMKPLGNDVWEAAFSPPSRGLRRKTMTLASRSLATTHSKPSGEKSIW